MAYEWTADVPSGVLKNHDLSSDVLEAAVAMTKFVQFVDPVPGYGKKKGDTVTVQRVSNVAEPASANFGERDRVPVDTFSISSFAITVQYWGRAIEFTEMAEVLSHYDVRDKMQRKLMQQMKLVLDTGASTAFKTAKIKFQPTSLASGTIATNGTASTTALVNGTVSHLKVIRDYMADTIHVPGWRGSEEYQCLASTKFCRGIRNDPEFIESKKYRDDNGWFAKGEIGMVENIHVIEVNHTNALANNKGSGGVLGEAMVFGDEAVAMAVVMDPELRIQIPGNYGLDRGIAWIGLLNYGLEWDTATDGEARVVHITSA